MSAPLAPVSPDTGPRLLRRRVRVGAIEGGRVRVEVERAGACARCGARASCGAAALSAREGSDPLDLAAPLGAALRPGDEVDLACPAGPFLAGAALGYLLPATALALVAGTASALGWSDLAAALACLPALALSVLPLARAERTGSLRRSLRIEAAAPETEA